MKILSIDFDIIMAPSIQLYNDMVPMLSWDELLKNPQLILSQADLIHYKRLTILITQIISYLEKDSIIFIENHGLAYDFIKNNNNIDLINIDHHHDIGYPNSEEDKVTCANWIEFLNKEGKINSYIWLNNDTSIDCIIDTNLKYKNFLLKDYNLSDIGKIDKLILCLSEPWIPPAYRNLFFLWRDLVSIKYGEEFVIDYSIPNLKNK